MLTRYAEVTVIWDGSFVRIGLCPTEEAVEAELEGVKRESLEAPGATVQVYVVWHEHPYDEEYNDCFCEQYPDRRPVWTNAGATP